MNPENDKPKNNKVEEPTVAYQLSKIQQKGIDRATFDFDTAFKNGLTPEEFKAEMHKRIKAYPWKK